ncbi:Stress-induced protein, KGG, repeat [uncultured Caudovirales phage]|uniref:Stress-induced protein, KGG, repeat n=1 Tax=uncultured Caudovirales phage TaxID=2100421 RepID=A0A6J7WVL3_9CAUD|nr:Stress-induced protein, KGG, repeat [uncultured Caudovirales phage]
MNDVVKKLRGLAAVPLEKRLEIARKGGKAVRPEKRAFSQNKELASKAGRKGGLAVKAENRAFKRNEGLAALAGRLGAKAKAAARSKEKE